MLAAYCNRKHLPVLLPPALSLVVLSVQKADGKAFTSVNQFFNRFHNLKGRNTRVQDLITAVIMGITSTHIKNRFDLPTGKGYCETNYIKWSGHSSPVWGRYHNYPRVPVSSAIRAHRPSGTSCMSVAKKSATQSVWRFQHEKAKCPQMFRPLSCIPACQVCHKCVRSIASLVAIVCRYIVLQEPGQNCGFRQEISFNFSY